VTVALKALKRNARIELKQVRITGSVLTVSFGCLHRERGEQSKPAGYYESSNRCGCCIAGLRMHGVARDRSHT
jgi:hypothetical protein